MEKQPALKESKCKTKIRCPGRPRDTSKHEVILRATICLLLRVGFADFTIDAVAIEAKAGKGSIYRRWRSKEELIGDAIAAVFECDAQGSGHPIDNLSDDLKRLLCFKFRPDDPWHQDLMIAILASGKSKDRILLRVRQSMEKQEQFSVVGAFRRARDRGEIRVPIALEELAEIPGALALHRFVVLGQRVTRKSIEQIVDEVVLPLVLVKKR